MNINDLVSYNIHELCNRKQITLTELETALSLSAGYFDRTRILSIWVCYDIANYFDISLDDLVSDKYQRDKKLARLAQLQAEIAALEKELGVTEATMLLHNTPQTDIDAAVKSTK